MNMQQRLELIAKSLKEIAERVEDLDFDLSDLPKELLWMSGDVYQLSEDKFGRLQFNPSTGEEEK